MTFATRQARGAFAIVEEGAAPPLPADLAQTVDRIWDEEAARPGRTLFDGRIFTADRVDAAAIRGHFTPYRRFLAQRRRPDLFAALNLRPVAVAGLLICADGVVFGRRGQGMTQDAGAWELVPSGGIDGSARRADGAIDPERQILAELVEETGISADRITAAELFAVIEDPASHVVDLCYRLSTDLTGAAVLASHAGLTTLEYTALDIVALADIAAFVARPRARMVALSIEMLAAAGL